MLSKIRIKDLLTESWEVLTAEQMSEAVLNTVRSMCEELPQLYALVSWERVDGSDKYTGISFSSSKDNPRPLEISPMTFDWIREQMFESSLSTEYIGYDWMYHQIAVPVKIKERDLPYPYCNKRKTLVSRCLNLAEESTPHKLVSQILSLDCMKKCVVEYVYDLSQWCLKDGSMNTLLNGYY